jgi:hypothetical protein
MADSTLANLNGGVGIVAVADADKLYIEDAGVAKFCAASVLKTYMSDTPTLVTPVLGVPSSGDISACTGGPTLTSATLITPALGTPASGVATNLTGTAAGLTAGNVTTNANLTGHVTSVGNAAVLGSFTVAQLNTALSDGTMGDVLADCTVPFTGNMRRSVEAGITADVGSAQGGSPITKDINQISTCANAGDSITLPTAAAGLTVTIINNGANAADVFPASGDNCGGGVDTAVSLAAGANITYVAYDATTWVAVT